MNIKVINNTPSVKNIVIHPSLNIFHNKQEIGAYAKGAIPPKGSIYGTILNSFSIACMFQNPDGSSIVTQKLPLADYQKYNLQEGYMFNAEPSTDAAFIANNTNNLCNCLIYNAKSCICKEVLKPAFEVPLISTVDFLNNICISLWKDLDFPDFFSSDDLALHKLSLSPISALQCDYITITIEENCGTSAITLSDIDCTPFSPYNSK